MKNYPSLKEFIQKTIQEINESLPDSYIIDEAIDFEITLTSSKMKNGSLDLKVISGKLENDNEVTQKVNFSVINQVQQEKNIKSTGNTVIKFITKGFKELSKLDNQQNKKLKSDN
jgi:hypothetical protein